MKNTALIIAGIIFSLMTIIHIFRYINGWGISIAHQNIPMAASIYGGIIAAILAIWMFAAALKK